MDGIIPLERVRGVTEGMDHEHVKSLCGPPKEILSPADLLSPTQFWQSLGTSFDFAVDREIDQVWHYLHDRRGKLALAAPLHTYIGFRDGKVTGTWQVQEAAKPKETGG